MLNEATKSNHCYLFACDDVRRDFLVYNFINAESGAIDRRK